MVGLNRNTNGNTSVRVHTHCRSLQDRTIAQILKQKKADKRLTKQVCNLRDTVSYKWHSVTTEQIMSFIYHFTLKLNYSKIGS